MTAYDRSAPAGLLVPSRVALIPATLLLAGLLLATFSQVARDAEPPLAWSSSLYPGDWTPATTGPEGRFLHDFSYAGYRSGAMAPGSVAAASTINVVTDHGADPTGQGDATRAIQAALDAAAATTAGGRSVLVHFPAGLYRVDGTLLSRGSGVVLAGEGPEASRLWFTRHKGMSYENHLTVGAAIARGPDLPLATDAEPRSFEVSVPDASGLRPGDDVAVGWVVTDAFVAEHGMTGVWRVFNGEWQPFFRRTVVAVRADENPHRVVLDAPLRYPAKLRDGASLRVETGYVSECGVRGLGFANAVGRREAWDATQVHALALEGVKDCFVLDVASFPSPGSTDTVRGEPAHLQSGGILVENAKRVTVAGSAMANAQHRGGGGNGYLFEVRQSSEVLFRDLQARNGRHNFIQNWGFGTSGWVLLRVASTGGEALPHEDVAVGTPGLSEFHHSLAMANLVDSSRFDDGFQAVNRGADSSGAGHSATQTVLWRSEGLGVLRSQQFGHGFVIGTSAPLAVWTSPLAPGGEGTAPEDFVEGLGRGASLVPASLYEDQLARRLAG